MTDRARPLAKPLGRILHPAQLTCDARHYFRCEPALVPETLQQPPGRLPGEERRALERDSRPVQSLLEVGRPRVCPAEDRHLLERNALAVERAHALDDQGVLVLGPRQAP